MNARSKYQFEGEYLAKTGEVLLFMPKVQIQSNDSTNLKDHLTEANLPIKQSLHSST
jgi:hypothetical protein